jgi:hypothetical protein
VQLPWSLVPRHGLRPSRFVPASLILIPYGPNRASGRFHSSCKLIYLHSPLHVDLLKDRPILLSVRHICHLVMEGSLDRYAATGIFPFRIHLCSSNLIHGSRTVERCFRRRAALPVIVAEHCIGGCQCVGNVGVVHVSPKSHERWPPNRSFRQSRAEGFVSHMSSWSLDSARMPRRVPITDPCRNESF